MNDKETDLLLDFVKDPESIIDQIKLGLDLPRGHLYVLEMAFRAALHTRNEEPIYEAIDRCDGKVRDAIFKTMEQAITVQFAHDRTPLAGYLFALPIQVAGLGDRPQTLPSVLENAPELEAILTDAWGGQAQVRIHNCLHSHEAMLEFGYRGLYFAGHNLVCPDCSKKRHQHGGHDHDPITIGTRGQWPTRGYLLGMALYPEEADKPLVPDDFVTAKSELERAIAGQLAMSGSQLKVTVDVPHTPELAMEHGEIDRAIGEITAWAAQRGEDDTAVLCPYLQQGVVALSLIHGMEAPQEIHAKVYQIGARQVADQLLRTGQQLVGAEAFSEITEEEFDIIRAMNAMIAGERPTGTKRPGSI